MLHKNKRNTRQTPRNVRGTIPDLGRENVSPFPCLRPDIKIQPIANSYFEVKYGNEGVMQGALPNFLKLLKAGIKLPKGRVKSDITLAEYWDLLQNKLHREMNKLGQEYRFEITPDKEVILSTCKGHNFEYDIYTIDLYKMLPYLKEHHPRLCILVLRMIGYLEMKIGLLTYNDFWNGYWREWILDMFINQIEDFGENEGEEKKYSEEELASKEYFENLVYKYDHEEPAYYASKINRTKSEDYDSFIKTVKKYKPKTEYEKKVVKWIKTAIKLIDSRDTDICSLASGIGGEYAEEFSSDENTFRNRFIIFWNTEDEISSHIQESLQMEMRECLGEYLKEKKISSKRPETFKIDIGKFPVLLEKFMMMGLEVIEPEKKEDVCQETHKLAG